MCDVQKWGAFAKLGYAAAAQDCTETFTWATMAVFAGLLPNGPAATASWAVWNQTCAQSAARHNVQKHGLDQLVQRDRCCCSCA